MSAASLSKIPSSSFLSPIPPPSISQLSTLLPLLCSNFRSHPHPLSSSAPRRGRRSRRTTTLVFSKPSEGGAEAPAAEQDECLKKLPEKNKPLYSHSLPCIEAWLKQLGFYRICALKALWFVEKPDWHAQLSLDVTDLCIRYLKTGPGNLEKDVERRFSYALSREDVENAILGGP